MRKLNSLIFKNISKIKSDFKTDHIKVLGVRYIVAFFFFNQVHAEQLKII